MIRLRRNHIGFTLVELMLVSLFLAIIGVYTATHLNSTIKTQKVIDQKTSLQQAGISIMERLQDDISQTIFVESFQKLTFFKGRAHEISFSSLSHDPPNPDDRECEEAEISYSLESDREATDSKTQVLMRKEVPFLSGEQEQDAGYQAIPVARQINNLEFSYSSDGIKYLDEWDVYSADHLNQLPKLVRIKLTLQDVDERQEYFEALINLPMTDDLNSQATSASGKNPPAKNPSTETP